LSGRRGAIDSLMDFYSTSDQCCIITDRYYEVLFFTPAAKHLFPALERGAELSSLGWYDYDAAERTAALVDNIDGHRCMIMPIVDFSETSGYLFMFNERTAYGKDFDIFDQFSVFFADMSHEFRSPINDMLASICVLGREVPENSKASKYLSIIDRSSRRLLRLADSLISMSRVYAFGPSALKFARVDLPCFINGVCAAAAGLSAALDVTIDVSSSEEHHLFLTDALLLEVAVVNILSNAFKHSEKGQSVEVRLNFTDSDRVVITISDHGPGISDVNRALRRFSHPDGAPVSEGVGLGLSISRKFFSLIGGVMDIGPRQDGEHGTCVTVSLTSPPVSDAHIAFSSPSMSYADSVFNDLIDSFTNNRSV